MSNEFFVKFRFFEKLHTFNLFRLIKRTIYNMSFDVVAKNGNNIEATFDFVERIVRLAAFERFIVYMPVFYHMISQKVMQLGSPT